jgi:hypothetical protein
MERKKQAVRFVKEDNQKDTSLNSILIPAKLSQWFCEDRGNEP